MLPNEEKTSTKKMIRTMVESHPRYSAIPPHTPASILSVRDFLSLAAIILSFCPLCDDYNCLYGVIIRRFRKKNNVDRDFARGWQNVFK